MKLYECDLCREQFHHESEGMIEGRYETILKPLVFTEPEEYPATPLSSIKKTYSVRKILELYVPASVGSTDGTRVGKDICKKCLTGMENL